NPKVRAGSRELLENLVVPPLREPLLAFVDDAPDASRVLRAPPYYDSGPLDYEQLLGRILEESGESLRCLVVYHIGELGLVGFRPRLEALRREETGFFLARVVEKALRVLSPGSALAHA